MGSGKNQELTPFEKAFIEFFTKGKVLGVALKAGEKRFRKKAAKEWMEFFERLSAYTDRKSARPDEIREFVFRGTSDTGLVGDLVIKRRSRDRVEKFARIDIVGAKNFSPLQPGDKVDIAEYITSGVLEYTALHYKPTSLLAANLQKQAAAAARAREALSGSRMGVSSRAESLARDHLKRS